MTPPDLPTLRTLVALQREFSDLFAQLSVLPYGSTQNYNASGGKSCEHPGGKRPAGESHPDCAKALAAWTAARWDERRMRGVLTMMREDLRGWKHAKPAENLLDDKALKREKARDAQKLRGWTDKEVAKALHMSVREVHEARDAVKCCPAKGYPYVGVSVVELANRGNSMRQIQAMLRINNLTTVARVLKKAS
jgi:hypothetical protein